MSASMNSAGFAGLATLLMAACCMVVDDPNTVASQAKAAAKGGEKAAPKVDVQVSKDDVKAVVDGNNEFAFDLYRRLAENEKTNVVFSPYSISTALAMTYAGGFGNTAEKMAKALHFPLAPERFHPAFGKLTADFQMKDKERPFELLVANALWGQKGQPFRSEFLELTRKNYHADLREVDFKSRDAVNTINQWIALQTKDKIKGLLGKLDEETRLVLTNAIYLKASWKQPFDPKLTKTAPFEVTPDNKVIVPMMLQSSEIQRGVKFAFHEGDGFQWLGLPYKGDRLSMVVLLPQKKGQLAACEKTLAPPALQKGLNQMTSRDGTVILPLFKLTLEFKLLGHLKAMGMPDGPFTGMTSANPLYISGVYHKAFIEVDEVGTEAAAATAVIMRPISEAPPPFQFIANHPFLFLIRDNLTGSILFLGRVSDPSRA